MDTYCNLCDKVCEARYSVAMWEGKVVPHDEEGPWAGMPVCEECFSLIEILEEVWKSD